MRRWLWLIFLLLPVRSYGQGSFSGNLLITDSIGRPIPGATITTCNAAGTPPNYTCGSYAAMYTNPQLTLPVGGTHTFTTDGYGNVNWWGTPAGTPAMYCYLVTGQGSQSSTCFPFQLDATVGSNISSCTVNGVIYAGSICYPTIGSAITALAGGPGSIYVMPGSYPELVLLSKQNGVTVNAAQCGPNESSTTQCGAVVTGTGATNEVLIHIFDSSHTKILGLNANCGSTSGSTGYQYDSDNSPSASYFELGNVTISNCHQGFTSGLISDTASITDYQSDLAWIHDLQILGSESTAQAIHINSHNALTQSVIERINAQSVNIVINDIRGPSGTLMVKDVNGGNPVGSTPTIISESASNPVCLDLIHNESENSGWTYALHDSSTNNSYNYPCNLIGNQFNQPVLIDGTSHVNSIGNNGGSVTNVWTAAGTSYVWSQNDASTSNAGTAWVTSGSGKVGYLGSSNSSLGQVLPGAINASRSGTTASTLAGIVGSCTSTSGCTTGALFFGPGFINTTAAGQVNINPGANNGNVTLGGTGTTLVVPGSSSGSSSIAALATASGAVSIPNETAVLVGTIASGTSTLGNTLIGAGACATVVTTTATNALTTDTVAWSYASAPSTTDGQLTLTEYMTAGNVNWKVCNGTAGGLTPSGLVVNWRVIR